MHKPLNDFKYFVVFNVIDLLNFTNTMKEEIGSIELNHYIKYLNFKNLLLIKIDVEGSERKVFKDCSDLFIKYHIFFSFFEWRSKFSKLKDIYA